jgi:hypothetical protein
LALIVGVLGLGQIGATHAANLPRLPGAVDRAPAGRDQRDRDLTVRRSMLV